MGSDLGQCVARVRVRLAAGLPSPKVSRLVVPSQKLSDPAALSVHAPLHVSFHASTPVTRSAWLYEGGR